MAIVGLLLRGLITFRVDVGSVIGIMVIAEPGFGVEEAVGIAAAEGRPRVVEGPGARSHIAVTGAIYLTPAGPAGDGK